MIFATILLVLPLVHVAHSDCIKGYEQYGSLCYKVSGVLEFATFSTANSTCQSEGGELATITNAFEDSFVMKLAAKEAAVDYWLGFRCPKGNATGCYWLDKTQFTYSNFYFGYPAVLGDCGAVSLDFISKAQGKWYTAACSVEIRYVCQQAAFGNTTTMRKTDSIESLPGSFELSSDTQHPKNLRKLV